MSYEKELSTNLARERNHRVELNAVILSLRTKLAEAERERNASRKNFLTMQGTANELRKRAEKAEAERDALAKRVGEIERETVERCAVIAEDEDGHFTWSGMNSNIRLLQQCAREIAAAIRSLKPEART